MYTPPTPEEINQLVCDFISRVREIEKSKKTDPFAGKPLFLQPDKAEDAEDEPQDVEFFRLWSNLMLF